MGTISGWNRKQNLVFLRYSRIHRVPLTPELVAALGLRFAMKHGRERRYAAASQTDQDTRGVSGRQTGKSTGRRVRIGEMMLAGKRFSTTSGIAAALAARSSAPRPTIPSARGRESVRALNIYPARLRPEGQEPAAANESRRAQNVARVGRRAPG